MRRASASSSNGHALRRPAAARAVASETGSASIEFIAAGLILLVPMMYLVIAFGQVQSHAMAAQAAARQFARAMAVSESGGPDRADRVLAAVADEYGIDPAAMQVRASCAPVPTPCPAPGAYLTIEVRTVARLPLLGAIPGLGDRAGLTVSGQAVHRITDSDEEP